MTYIINIADEKNEISTLLNNFTLTPFEYGGIRFLSIESFIQAIKFESQDKQIEIACLEGYKARMKGKKRTKFMLENPYITWNDEKVMLHTNEYYTLIYNVLLEKFKQNLKARVALLLTSGYQLIIDNGLEEPKFNTLPNKIFIQILEQVREDLKKDIRHNTKKYYQYA